MGCEGIERNGDNVGLVSHMFEAAVKLAKISPPALVLSLLCRLGEKFGG